MTARCIALTVLIWFSSFSIVAQVLQSPDRTLTTADGLPSSTVTGIVQDQTGFIWIGTADGLARFDGRQIKVFRHDERANSLAENSISSVQMLPNSILLLQTRTGDFQQFDPRNEQFSSFLPLMDGYELTQHLKTSSLTSHIGVVLLSARAAHESRMAGLTQGADDYLTKPFHVDELRQRLHNLLNRQQTLRDYYHKQFTQPDAEFRPETIADDFLRNLNAGIDEKLDDPTFGVDELARKVGMSRRTLDRKLAAVVSQSANNGGQHRLKRAPQFMLEGRTVSEAAYLVGYESPAHFSQIFKELFQKTPSEFTQR